MELKIYAAKRMSGYGGGLIVVAANDVDEAYELYINWALDSKRIWIYERYKDGDVEYDIKNEYPKEDWYEIPNVRVVCMTPRVIDEDGYTK